MLEVKRSVHGLPSVEVNRASPEQCAFLSSAVQRNRFDDPVYHLRTDAQAFLQGYDERSGWVLVEFWTRDPSKYGPFVDWLNANFPPARPAGVSFDGFIQTGDTGADR